MCHSSCPSLALCCWLPPVELLLEKPGPSVSLGTGPGQVRTSHVPWVPESPGEWARPELRMRWLLKTPPHEHKLSSCPLPCQVLSPLAKNLFHRAISESGVALTAVLVKKDMKDTAQQIGVFAGCKTTSSAVLVHCLRQKTEDELLETSLKMKFFTLDLFGDPREVRTFGFLITGFKS
ncbi:liver carboxylesterase 1 [Leptonychotes weddellii]|uniref:Liver carboxylesterase 1 n=1 Tax=Leptonychotes weddellii TaxID=9713 RepID=A0A7F8REW9_LEPWE|nr:liver carboxylesterase 1 [Leptonychotes weddellii]